MNNNILFQVICYLLPRNGLHTVEWSMVQLYNGSLSHTHAKSCRQGCLARSDHKDPTHWPMRGGKDLSAVEHASSPRCCALIVSTW